MTFDTSKICSDVLGYAQEIVEAKTDSDAKGFYIVRLNDILYKIKLWKDSCPRIQPFYAVKCNDDPMVMALLANSGVNFDCASRQEMEKVLTLGVDPSRIVYAHPVKTLSYLEFARQNEVSRMTFDSFDELNKIKGHYPDAELILRVKVDDGGCVFKLSKKFGATEETSEYLLEEAQKLGLNVIGISFHVGCSKKSCSMFINAIESARRLFDIGERLGFTMKLLDIGGGFPGYGGCEAEFAELADAINMTVDKLFPVSGDYEIISEPGTFFVASSFTLFARIIGKKMFTENGSKEGICRRDENNNEDDHSSNLCNMQCPEAKCLVTDTKKRIEYYINDSVYVSFNMSFFNEDIIIPAPLNDKDRLDSPRMKSVVWGNTCDGVDKVKSQCYLPDMKAGDWLSFSSLGAYSVVLETPFNGMDIPERFYLK